MGRKLKTLGVILIYGILAVIIVLLVSRNGVYPSGSDTLSHIYKGDVLYREIQRGNLYPLFDPMWYNGVDMMRYWAPLPIYALAGCQALAGGSALMGYLAYAGLIFFLGALAWLWVGCRHGRPWLGAFLGALWFFMPNNLYALFVEGNLPRALCMVLLPLFVSYVHDYLLEDRFSSLPKMIVCFALMALCDLVYAAMIAVSLLIFAVAYMSLYRKQGRKVLDCLICVALAFLLTGIWSYASLQGGVSSSNPQVMQRFFQNMLISINPLYRIQHGQNYFYYGLAAFCLGLFGIVFSKRRAMPGFWMSMIIFFCTTTTMYNVMVQFPGSQYLWMLRFISIALCFTLYSLLLWDSLKKPLLYLVCFLLFVDMLPSLGLIRGSRTAVSVEQRFDTLEKGTLLDQAKEIAVQRLTLMDASALEATGAYLVSGYKKGVPGTFGSSWQTAATAHNIVQLNQALEDGGYLYLFDRCIELGSDTVLIRTDQLDNGTRDEENVDAAAATLGYDLVDSNDGYRLYHMDCNGNFGVISKYKAIGIGSSAPTISISFPAVEETISTNLNDYTFEELSQYEVIYLAGFTYDDKEAAEKLIMDLSDSGVRILILADGIPADEHTGVQSFLGLNCYNINFKNGFPELDTIDGKLNCDLFPDGYTDWKTVYVNGLEEVWGTMTDLEQQLDFYGSIEDGNIIVIGLNLTYHYALTKDSGVGALLAHALMLNSYELPERTLVPLSVDYGINSIDVTSEYDEVDTTLAWHDIYESRQNIYMKNYLTYVDKGHTVIALHYPYLWEGAAISAASLVASGAFLFFVRWRKKRTADKNEAPAPQP